MSNQIETEHPLSDGFNFRPASLNDIEDILDLFNTYWETITGVKQWSLEDFQRIFTVPGFDITESLRVVLSPEDKIIAAGLVLDLGSPPVHPNFFGVVHPNYENQGIGSYLLDWGENRARKAIQRVPEGIRVSMYVQTGQNHTPTIWLLEKMNLSPIRYSWYMMIDLDKAPAEPVWPEGIRIQTYQENPDLEGMVFAIDEAFEDHWGYVKPENEEERFERIRYTMENDELFDPTLWFMAIDGEEIAAIAQCESHYGQDMETGWVETLGVRRAWRRKGLGLAMLLLSFNELYKRGFKHVGLGVDAENLSGATRLYEKAGMHKTNELSIYEKELRPGKELAKQT